MNLRSQNKFPFNYETLPDKSKFIMEVCKDLPQDAVKRIQTLPGNNVDLTLRNETLVRTLFK